jgi:hypothetical protein
MLLGLVVKNRRAARRTEPRHDSSQKPTLTQPSDESGKRHPQLRDCSTSASRCQGPRLPTGMCKRMGTGRSWACSSSSARCLWSETRTVRPSRPFPTAASGVHPARTPPAASSRTDVKGARGRPNAPGVRFLPCVLASSLWSPRGPAALRRTRKRLTVQDIPAAVGTLATMN